jgi:transposase
MEFALWTRGAVMQFIEREFGIRVSIRATGEYLRRWGFTPQKPIRRAYEQRPEAVRQWLDQQYPAIEQRAKAEGGEIHWGDETALVNTDVRGRSYAPRGKTPVTMAVGGTREKLSMISTVTNQGRANWMIIDGAFNHERLIEFLDALRRDGKRRRKKVFLILDNLGVHHCKPVKAWLAEHHADIEAFFLPSYSPELNPDERLNADLKQAIGSKVPVRTKAKLRAAANEHMQFIAANRDRVRAYFQDPIVKYAA